VGFSAGGNAGFGEGNLASNTWGSVVKFYGEFIPLPKTDKMAQKKVLNRVPKRKKRLGDPLFLTCRDGSFHYCRSSTAPSG